MNILYIAHRIPYPPNKGDKIRAFHQLKHLSGTNNRLFVCALVDAPADLKYREKLAPLCEQLHLVVIHPLKKKLLSLRGLVTSTSLSALYFWEKEMQETINRIISEQAIDVIVCFSGTSAEYIFRNPSCTDKFRKHPRLVMDFCDVDSVKWLEYGERTSFPLSWLYKQEARLLHKLEQRTCEEFDQLIVISEQEKKLLSPCFREANTAAVIGNGVDLNYFHSSPLPDTSEGLKLLFTGAMDYHANVDGVLWFVDQVWPQLQKGYPDLSFIVAGRHPAPEIQRLSQDPHITVTGEVEDIRDYYIQASCCVIPLRIARGIQNKLLEAMAMARPVVSTSVAFQGIQAEPEQDLLIADDPKSFAQAVHRILQDSSLRQDMAFRARQAMEQSYSWSTNQALLTQLLEPAS